MSKQTDAGVTEEQLGKWARLLGVSAKPDDESDEDFRRRVLAKFDVACAETIGDTEGREAQAITLENRIRLQLAASALRDVLPGYGIYTSELQAITRPLAEEIQKMPNTSARD